MSIKIYCPPNFWGVGQLSEVDKMISSWYVQGHGKGKEIVVAKVTMMCIGVFLLSWLPYATVAVFAQVWGAQNINPYMSTLPALLAKSNCIYNPIIYALAHPVVRYRQIFHTLVPNRNQSYHPGRDLEVC